MTTESKELAFMPAREKAMQVFTTDNALDPYLAHVRAEIDAFKPDLTTKKGRDAIASMAYKVAQSKSALETLGKSLADEAKEIPKKIDATRKAMKETLDSWRDEVRKPLDDWETEQKEIEAKRIAEEAAKALAVQIEADHEIALILYADHLRKQEEAARAEAERKAAEELRIAQEAAERATREANEKAQAAILQAQLAEETAKREKADAEAAAAQAILDAQEAARLAELNAKLAAEAALAKAERDKQLAIEQERQRAAAEAQRLASIKAAEDAAAAKAAANKNHQKTINNEIADDLIDLGCTPDLAKKIVIAAARKSIRNLTVNY